VKHAYLYLLISVSGASVLAIELLGTRMLGPFYGVSLFLWSALITVTLAGLAVGYFLGGRMADRAATYARLGWLPAAAGVWLITVPWIKAALLRVTEPFGPRVATLIAALVLFFIPLMLLGMVSPYAIKLRACRLEEVGRSAGNLYAISTLAGVAAALLMGFVLIPGFGVSRLTAAVGIVLVATGILGPLGIKTGASRPGGAT
jgi:predicted membrane-bound spermidine synthase